ncbi:MAG: ester cyclase [Arenicella sp.]
MKINSLITIIIATLLSFNAMAGAKRADIEPFYDFLSNPASENHAKAFVASVTTDWQSIGNYSGVNKTQEKFVQQIKGFSKLIPDLDWAIQDVIVKGDTVVVRSRATGTPNGPLFGVDGQGKGFDILTIDIHTIKNGRVVETYHVEDWAGALQQLKAQ